MRTIKFKCWHPGKGWVREEEVMDFNIGMLTHATGVKFCQFTGLSDRNGNEIYDGDLVSIDTIGNEPYIKNTPVLYIKGYYIVKSIEGGCYTLGNFFPSVIEITGNIHSKPELVCEHEIYSITFDTLPESTFCIKCNKEPPCLK